MKFIIFIVFNLCTIYLAKGGGGDEELQINIIPSEKYKMNHRDLQNLKSDIERQVNIKFNKI
jgi:hypothetical protein